MSDTMAPEDRSPTKTGANVDYLLKELEFQVAIETKARDRMENMVQYLLTTIAAVIGAALLVNEMQINGALLLFTASLLISVFLITAFYRSCRLRYITTYARVTRNTIRSALEKANIHEASQLIGLEGNPSGFGKRMLQKMIILLASSSVSGGLTCVFALLLIFHLNHLPLVVTGSQATVLIVLPLSLTAIIAATLGIVLTSQKKRADEFISNPVWRALPDYDL